MKQKARTSDLKMNIKHCKNLPECYWRHSEHHEDVTVLILNFRAVLSKFWHLLMFENTVEQSVV